MNCEVKKIDIDSYCQLQEKINEINPNYYLSAINYCLWKHYGYEMFYVSQSDAIYIYALKMKAVKQDDQIGLYIIRPIVKENVDNILEYLKTAFKIACEFIKKQIPLYWEGLFEQDLLLFKDFEVLSTLEASYIYPTNQLKYMAGKKMQKRRNFLNYFTKNYGSVAKIVKYKDFYYDDVIKFCKNHIMSQEPDNFREYELNWIKDLLKIKSTPSYGSIMFYEGKIIGVTFGFVINDKYEIFLEKANRNFKGSYQYLLAHNLQLNNIEVPYVDRQDSERELGLSQSKKSYKPIKIVHTFFGKTKTIWNNENKC